MRRIPDAERRARIGVRHALAAASRAPDPAAATGAVVALHSTDPVTVFLSVRARTDGAPVAAVERSLYDDRSLVRMLGMRRTLFVVPDDLAPVVHSSSTAAIALRERRRLIDFINAAGVLGDGVDVAAWLDEIEASALRALEARGSATARQLAVDEPRLGVRMTLSAGKPYEAQVAIGSRLLLVMGAEGKVVRGRPLGTWISSQYRWAPMDAWLPRGLPDLPVAEAQAELVRRWLARFGPGTVEDVRWWTGWTVREVRRALLGACAEEVELDDGATGHVLQGDVEPTPPPEPWVALLPGLDPTTMGWTARDWYLGPHRRALFDANGNAGPTIWADGRIVGGWINRPDGSIAWRLLEDAGAETRAAVEAEAERLATWLGDARFTPRFRTPLERELLAEAG